MGAVLLAVGVAVAIMLASTFAWAAWAARRDAWHQKLEHRAGLEGATYAALRLNRAEENRFARGLRDLLERAGDHEGLDALFARTLVFTLAGTATTFVLFHGPARALGLLAATVPFLLLRSRARRRSAELTRQLPDALDRIARTLRSGHAFSDALRLAATELADPIGEELARVTETHRLGVDLRDALEALARRNADNFDLRLLVGAILLHRETGGNLVEILDQLAETVRERTIFHQKVRALTAEVNVSALILGALPFVVTVALFAIEPAYLVPLFHSTLGHAMLAGAGTSLVLGALLMRQIAAVEV